MNNYQTKGQHLVSQVLLREFADADEMLIAHAVDGRRFKLPVRKAAKQNHFIGIDADRFETLWGGVEAAAAAALRALRDDDMEGVRLQEHALKDLMSLHLARAFSTQVLWERALERSTPSRRAGMLRDSDFLSTMRTCPVMGLLTDEQIVDAVSAYTHRINGAGTVAFANAVAQQFEEARARFGNLHLEVARAGVSEFLLPDVPCITVDTQTDRVGLLAGATTAEADAICMPATPHHLLSLRTKPPTQNWHVLNGDMVGRLNRLLVRGSRRFTYSRPESGLELLVGNVLSTLP